MVKDKRHKTIKILIEGGHIKEFQEIFDHIPKTTVAEHLGIHFNRISRMIKKVADIKMNDLFLLSGYFEIDAKILFELVYNQHNSSNKSPRKKN